MATITAAPPTDTRTRTRNRWRNRARAALDAGVRQGALMAGAVRHRDWSPALTIGGFACVDTSAFQLAAAHISPGIGLLITGISAWLYDWSRDR